MFCVHMSMVSAKAKIWHNCRFSTSAQRTNIGWTQQTLVMLLMPGINRKPACKNMTACVAWANSSWQIWMATVMYNFKSLICDVRNLMSDQTRTASLRLSNNLRIWTICANWCEISTSAVSGNGVVFVHDKESKKRQRLWIYLPLRIILGQNLVRTCYHFSSMAKNR